MKALLAILLLSTAALGNVEDCPDKFAHLVESFDGLARTQVELDFRKARADAQSVVISMEDAVADRRRELREAGVSEEEIDTRVAALIPKYAEDPEKLISAASMAQKPRNILPHNEFLSAPIEERDQLVAAALQYMEAQGLPAQPAMRKAFAEEDPTAAKGFILAATDRRWDCGAMAANCIALKLDLNEKIDGRSLLEVAADSTDKDKTTAKILATNDFYQTGAEEMKAAAKSKNLELLRIFVDAGHAMTSEVFWAGNTQSIGVGWQMVQWGYVPTKYDLAALARDPNGRVLLTQILQKDIKYLDTDDKNDAVLQELATYADTEEFNSYLDLGVRLNHSALGPVITHKKLATLKAIIARGVDVSQTAVMDPLVTVIRNVGIPDGSLELFKTLVIAGADYGRYDKDRQKFLLDAIASANQAANYSTIKTNLAGIKKYLESCWM